MKVLIAMSGGVDSSVAAMLLQEMGYELIGVTFQNRIISADSEHNAIEEAHSLAQKMGMKHLVIDVQDYFNKTVIQNFTNEYLHGRTPNPCTVCNYWIKWGALWKIAEEQHCQKLATGHYARIGEQNGRFFIRKGADIVKDQSYFLWKLSQDHLKNTIFPLGDYTKPEVKKIAEKLGFVNLSQKKESQEICFIPDNDYRSFLSANVPNYADFCKIGNFEDTSGKVIGQHQGYPNYTIGQRKGLGIALGVPAYVVAIRPEQNVVVLGKKEDLAGKFCRLSEVNLMKYATVPDDFHCTVRIRYRSHGEMARIFADEKGFCCEFENPVESITLGQSAVLYEGEDVIGGGVIS